MTILRILGKKGRVTIPYAIRMMLELKQNDILSFSLENGKVMITKEKLCDHCSNKTGDIADMLTYLRSLSTEAKHQALAVLTASLQHTKEQNDGTNSGLRTEK